MSSLVDLVTARIRRENPDGVLRFTESMIRQTAHMAFALAEDMLELSHGEAVYGLTPTTTWYDLPARCIAIESVNYYKPGESRPRRQLKPQFEADLGEAYNRMNVWDDSVGDPRIYMLRSAPGLPANSTNSTYSKIRFWPGAPANDGSTVKVHYLAHTLYDSGFTGGEVNEWLVDAFAMPFVRAVLSANGKRRAFLSHLREWDQAVIRARAMTVNPIGDNAHGFHGFKEFR